MLIAIFFHFYHFHPYPSPRPGKCCHPEKRLKIALCGCPGLILLGLLDFQQNFYSTVVERNFSNRMNRTNTVNTQYLALRSMRFLVSHPLQHPKLYLVSFRNYCNLIINIISSNITYQIYYTIFTSQTVQLYRYEVSLFLPIQRTDIIMRYYLITIR